MQCTWILIAAVVVAYVRSETTPAPAIESWAFWATLSNTLHPGWPLKLTIQILKGTDPVNVTIDVLNYEGTDTYVSGVPTLVYPGDVQVIQIDIPQVHNPKDDIPYYQVTVTGEGNSVNFQYEGYVYVEEKTLSIFIITDKAVYKPGQTVKIRILAVTPELKIMRNESKDVAIKDPKGNTIRQWLNLKDSTQGGVDELYFPLADHVLTGDWLITVTIKSIEESLIFTVDNYVLPTFEVELDTPSFGLSTDATLDFTVRARYTFGRPVTQAGVKINIKLFYDFLIPDTGDVFLTLTGQLNQSGAAFVQVTTDELLSLYTMMGYSISTLDGAYFIIHVNVTEDSTGRVESTSAEIKYYSRPYILRLLSLSPSVFKPGLPYTCYCQVKKADDTSLSLSEARRVSVMINVTYDVKLTNEEWIALYNISSFPEDTYYSFYNAFYYNEKWYAAYKEVILSIASPVQPLPETGLVTFTFDIPLEATNVNVFVKLLGPHYDEDFRHLDKAESTSGSYLQLQVFTEKPKVGEQLAVKAETTELVQSLIYQVYSKDQLVSTKTVVPKGDERSKIITFNVTVTYEMSPKLTLLVFYVRENNSEIVADAVSVFVDGLFQTQVNVRFSKEKVEPGEDVDLIVEGEPNSIVYLNVKDVKVDLLKSGNDITQDRVQNEVANYNGQDSMYWNYMFSYGWSFSFYGINTDYLLKSIDVNLIIDSFVATKANLGYYGENGRGPLSSQYGDPTTPSQASISVRKRFPENWAWDILDIKSNGQGVMTLTSPDTITSWVATAFSTHPQLGLSVVKAPAKVTTFRPLFVNLDLPLSIIRNEDYCFTATVFNYYPGEVPVLLTLDQSRSFSNIHVKRDGRQVSLSKENLYYSYFLGYLVENESVSSMFCVTPLVTGDIPVRVSALTNIDRLSDAIELNLTVKAEGVPRSSSHSFLVDLSKGSWVQHVPIEFPTSSVPDSQRITVNFAGNVLGSLSGDFVKLFRRQSYRTGEQNMMEFALNVYLLEFFYQTNNVKSDFMKQARDSLMKGIQYEMMYEHESTGGFSSFGSRNGNLPSLWLTAFVLKCFSQASRLNDRYRNIVTIDKEIIARSVTWIQYQQDENGAFIEYGSPFDMAMQSELDSGEELTAYTVIALWEARQLLDETIKATLDHKIEKATLLLTNQLDTVTDPYTICLLAYTLHLVDSPSKQKSFEKMQEVAIIGDGLRYWKRDEPSPEYYWWYTPVDPISIQATSYALLTYSKRGIAAIEGLPIIRWLVGQLRSDGLYVSTQATALAVEALSSVGSKLYTGQDIPMTLTLSYTSGTGQARAEKFHVNKDNEMLLQSLDIDYTNGAPKSISILARTDNNQVGPSLVMAEVVLYYNVQGETQAQVFNMSHVILTKRNNVYLTITIQTTSDKPAGLSILEVDIPSGYLPDLDVLSGNPAVSLVEVVDDTLMCYFDTGVITIKGLNLTVPLIATGGVLTKSHPRTYRIYDFYNPYKELTKTYALEDEDFCSKVPTVGVCQYQ